MTTLTFGKHKGTEIKNVPADYLEWGSSKLDSPKWRNAFQSELDRRNSEEKQKEVFIKANIDSPEIREMLIKEAEQELAEEENFSLKNDCQYDGRIITQAEIEKLADEKLESYSVQAQMERLAQEYVAKMSVTDKQLKLMESLWQSDQLSKKNFQTTEKYNLAMEYFAKLLELYKKL
jgi:hypothetical protein